MHNIFTLRICVRYSLSVPLYFFIITGCATKNTEIKNVAKKPELAYIRTSTPHFKINGYSLDQDVRKTIKTGKNLITFDGPVLLNIPKEPIIEVGPKKAAGAAFVACISALPVCPITLLLMQVAIGKTRQIEVNCFGSLDFYALNEESYRIKLEETSNIFPKINIIFISNNVTVAETQTECENINTNE